MLTKTYSGDHSLTFDKEQYGKFATDIVNQNLKDETGKIKNYCGINCNIDAEVL